MKKILNLAALGAIVTLMVSPMFATVASAAEFLSPGDSQGNVTLSSTETHHNAYVAGRSVFVNSPTTGDLYAAGGSVTVEGSVEQDIVVAGGNVTINGTVGGDVRVLGGEVIINNTVGGDVVSAGGNITLTEKSAIGGDAFIAGGQIIFDGPVNGNMKVSGGQVTINNKVGGQVDVMTNQSLIFGSKAVVPGKVTHKGVNDSVVMNGAQVSSIDYQKLPANQRRDGGVGDVFLTFLTLATIVKIISVIIFGLLLVKLYPRSTDQLVQSVYRKPWYNLGLGVVGLIVVPIVGIVLLITLIGAYIAITAFLVWMLLLLIASIITCIFVGAWIIKMYKKSPTLVVDWRAVVLGTIVSIILSLVPVLGILLFLVITMMAFGALMTHAHGHIKEEQGSPVINN